MPTGDLVMNAFNGAANPSIEALDPIRVDAVHDKAVLGVVYGFHVIEEGGQNSPMTGVVDSDFRGSVNVLCNCLNRFALVAKYERQGASALPALPHCHDTLALCVIGRTQINAVLDEIRLLHMPAGPHTVDFHKAPQFVSCLLRAENFPELVCQNESRAVIALEFAAQAERRMSVRSVYENRDCHQDIPQGHFPIGEDRPRREGELVGALLALEDAAGFVLIDAQAAALRAHGFSRCLRKADRPKPPVCLVVRHPGDLCEA